MAGLEDARDTEVRPGRVKVREILPPFFLRGIWVALVDEVVHPPNLAEVALVVDGGLLVGDLLVDLQEGGKLGIGDDVIALGRRGATWEMLRHFTEGGGDRVAVVELDEVGALRLQDRRVRGDINYGAPAQHLYGFIKVVDEHARGVGLVLARDLITIERAE